jgi:hypothetical protein
VIFAINQTNNRYRPTVEAVAAAIDTVHGRVDAGRETKMLRNTYALGLSTGLGLILVHSNSASAHQQQDIRQHYAPPAFHHHGANHRPASANKDSTKKDKDKEKDSKALTALKKEIRDLRKQVDEVEALRHELTDLKEKIWGPTPLPLTLSVLTRPQSSAVLEPKQVTLKLPDLSEPYRPPAPVNPATASLPVAIDERSAERAKPKSTVEEAKAYLINTATPGYTMVRQGVPVAIGRLHPDFIVKLAAAIKLARESGMTGAGVFSAYRPPAFGVGGFSDKFNSLHSYGLAADMTGIGGPGSRFAKLWQAIVRRVGLYLPYGASNRAEFNHTQLVPTKMASSFLRRTITASEPKNLQQMWLASGVNAYVVDVTTKPTLASATPEQRVGLPTVADQQATSPQSPEPARAPRRSRARPGKRGAARIRVSARSSARKKGKPRRRAAKT